MILLAFGAYLFLAVFAAGTMLVLQLQHYSLYPLVGRDGFARYVAANNRAALVPTILPALLLLAISGVLVIARPPFMTSAEAIAALALNLVQLAATFRWQRPLQAAMAATGFDAAKTRQLVATNWIRTVALGGQAVLASAVTLRALYAVAAV